MGLKDVEVEEDVMGWVEIVKIKGNTVLSKTDKSTLVERMKGNLCSMIIKSIIKRFYGGNCLKMRD